VGIRKSSFAGLETVTAGTNGDPDIQKPTGTHINFEKTLTFERDKWIVAEVKELPGAAITTEQDPDGAWKYSDSAGTQPSENQRIYLTFQAAIVK